MNERWSVNAWEKAIRQTDFSELFRSKSETDVLVEMPEFSDETNIDLNSVCQQMGIRAVFTDEADFSGMSCERLKLDAIIHEARIDLDRHGVRAAAVTVGEAVLGALPQFEVKRWR